MNMIGWKAWYSDGSVYSSVDIQWSDLPNDELQFVKIFYDETTKGGIRYAKILDGKDWYYMAPSGAIEGSPSVSWDGWVDPPCECNTPSEVVKRGTGVSNIEFQRLTEVVRESRWP